MTSCARLIDEIGADLGIELHIRFYKKQYLLIEKHPDGFHQIISVKNTLSGIGQFLKDLYVVEAELQARE